MDALDHGILSALVGRGRAPLSVLAKELRVSRERLTYRIERLRERGVILGFITQIDIARLDFASASVFFNIKADAETAFEKFVKEGSGFAWSSQFAGVWNYGVEIYGRDTEEITERLLGLCERFKDAITDHRLTVHRRKRHFYSRFLGISDNSVPAPAAPHKLDAVDRTILRDISTNARIDTTQLARHVKLTAPAVARRMRHLEKSGVILGYSAFIDPSELGIFQYSVFLVNKNIAVRARLLAYLADHPRISFLVEYVGDPFIEIGVIVKNPYDLRGTLQEIEGSFPHNHIAEVFLIQREILSIGPPVCVFE